MEAPKAPVAPVALEALYVAEESYGARPVSGFADAPGRRDDIVAYADDSNLVTRSPSSAAADGNLVRGLPLAGIPSSIATTLWWRFCKILN